MRDTITNTSTFIIFMNQILKDNRGRNHAIDLMKFIAAILITNSHMTSIYPRQFSQLATGGAIGDSLFFFCSGFCLMMGSDTDFFNWYKRRINRIFPTVFAVALIGIVFLSRNPTLKDVIIKGGGWFVQAIFLFYAIYILNHTNRTCRHTLSVKSFEVNTNK